MNKDLGRIGEADRATHERSPSTGSSPSVSVPCAADIIPGYGDFLDGLAAHLRTADPDGFDALVQAVNRTSQGLEIIPNSPTPTCCFCGEANHYGVCDEMRAEQQRNDPERGRPVPNVRTGP